jgi:hypothetical protein
MCWVDILSVKAKIGRDKFFEKSDELITVGKCKSGWDSVIYPDQVLRGLGCRKRITSN